MRAWTLQEVAMSRRRLDFLSDMIFLECDEELFLDYLDTELIPSADQTLSSLGWYLV
jgi:hypothetical protein